MIFHIQYYTHAHSDQTLVKAASHAVQNDLLKIFLLFSLAIGIVFGIIKTRPRAHAKEETKSSRS
ncbi:MAG: hypothetical protein HY564_00360 [Candidatus Jacksonbacteria bacterium]|nr:hypothetical protein [Candidatus Jacksonbacteria bacterium]